MDSRPILSAVTRIALDELAAASAPRPAGYFEMVCGRGRIEGDFLVIEVAEYQRIFREVRGLGDAVEVFAKPVARAIDAVMGTMISSCAGCGERREALNKLLPFQ